MNLANVGSADRIFRIILGAALILLPLLGIVSSTAATTGIVMMVVGAIALLTGFVAFAPCTALLVQAPVQKLTAKIFHVLA